jgi:hypothetical protein
MTNQVDQFPYYDPLIVNSNIKMSEVWIAALSAFIDTMNGYLSPFGDFIPIVTTVQRASIQSPVEGQIIYNIDATPGPPRTAELQVWQVKAGVAAWRVITTV